MWSNTPSTSTRQSRAAASAAPCSSALITSCEAGGIWTIQAGVFPENTASLRLHHSVGFRTVGFRERVGHHHGVWRDVVLIERRSAVITRPPTSDPSPTEKS